jgi:hypothetical protein
LIPESGRICRHRAADPAGSDRQIVSTKERYDLLLLDGYMETIMELKIYTYLSRHPLQKKLLKLWVSARLPVPSVVKLQIANEVHAEMIARLMGALIEGNGLSLDKALEVHYQLGTEIAGQIQDLMAINPDDASSLARSIDFVHSMLQISGKRVVNSSKQRAISHWNKCPFAGRLAQLKNCGGPYYCHLYQEIYKGFLYTLNKNARANDLTTTRSQGFEHCVLETWIDP